MTIEEIFNKLASHMVEGVMYHDDFAKAFDFLGLRGYAMCQNYHYMEESNNYRYLNHFYAKHYYKLIVLEKLDQPKIIPDTWAKYTTKAVDTNTKRNAIKDLFTKWINWEESTKKLYQEMRQEAQNLGEINAALYIDKLILEVSKELRHAERRLIELESINYDIVQITDWQEDLYHKYKKKIGW